MAYMLWKVSTHSLNRADGFGWPCSVQMLPAFIRGNKNCIDLIYHILGIVHDIWNIRGLGDFLGLCCSLLAQRFKLGQQFFAPNF